MVPLDYDLIRAAPRALNLSGVGDVLCFYTAHADWKIAQRANKAGSWPYDPYAVAQARQVMNKLLKHVEDIRLLNDTGISALVTALSYGGAAYHAWGWNPRPVEGFDHIFFYALEKHTGKHFIHGYPVLLGVWLGSRLQENNPSWVLETILQFGIDIRPSAMQISWQDVEDSLLGLKKFAEENDMLYTIANERTITKSWIDSAKIDLFSAYAEKWKD